MGKWIRLIGLGLWASVSMSVGAQHQATPSENVLDQAVRSRLAREWGVDSSRLVVRYSSMPDSIGAAVVTDVRFARRGGRLMITYDLTPGDQRTSTARAGVLVRVPVATRLMLPGDTLEMSAIRWEDRPVWGPPSQPADSILSGYLIRGRIVAGQVINPTVAIPPPAVRAGSLVKLRWEEGSLSVEMAGRALGTGYRGDAIPVRLREGGDRVMATIIGPGMAQLRER